MVDSDESTAGLALLCDQTAICGLADVAKVEAGKDSKNTLVQFRKLRIQILDCRSLDPVQNVPVAGVWIADGDGNNRIPIVQLNAEEKHWDIAKHLIIWKAKNGKWYEGVNHKSLVKASQIALNALSKDFDTGRPGNAYGPQGRTAYLKYRLVRKKICMKPEEIVKIKLFEIKKLDDKFIKKIGSKRTLKDITDADGKEITVNAPDDTACKEILREYNTRCYKAAQFHLAAAGFYPQGRDPQDGYLDEIERGKWTSEWINAFQRWRIMRFGEEGSVNWIQTKEEGEKLKKSPFITDKDGKLHIPIPVHKIIDGFRIELSFADFPLVAEATLKEYDSGAENAIHRDFPTMLPPIGLREEPAPLPAANIHNSKIIWVGDQHTDRRKGWGWWIVHTAPNGVTHRREFMSTLEFDIPPFGSPTEDEAVNWIGLHEKTRSLSLFFDVVSESSPAELVAYAMVWCTPVYDEFGDVQPTADEPAVTDSSYSWAGSDGDVNMHMHIVTQYYVFRGWDPFGGKGYGLYEHNAAGHHLRWRGGDGHHGMDVHATQPPNASYLFALHGGRMSHALPPAKLGYRVYIIWDKAASGRVTCAHCSDKVGASPRHVRAGEIVALGGRTGNLNAVSKQAGHTHLQVGGNGWGGTSNVLRALPDRANQCCIPCNTTPLLFPCKCETTSGMEVLRNCNFGNTNIASVCWAVAELCCPHMPRTVDYKKLEGKTEDAVKARQRIQAQLRKLGYYLPPPASVEGSPLPWSAAQKKALDGVFGAYKEEELAILTVKENCNVLSGPGKAAVWRAFKDTKLKQTGKEGDGFRVGNATDAWISSNLVEKGKSGILTVKITDKGVNVRSGPGTGNKKLWRALSNTKLKEKGKEGDWFRVENATDLWISSSKVRKKRLGKTREAIFKFKQDNPKLLPPPPSGDTPASRPDLTSEQKYTIDQHTLDKLDADEFAPLKPIQSPPA